MNNDRFHNVPDLRLSALAPQHRGARAGEVPGRRAAFSLIEIMVVVALMSVIILGLVAMFHQTQKALLGSTTQSDILETGRATLDIVVRDLENLTPANSTNVNGWNFYSRLQLDNNVGFLVQPLLAPGDFRTNVMQSFFFVTCTNQHWSASGYVLDRPDLGVATLYRTNFNLGTNILFGSSYVSNVMAIPKVWMDFENLVNAASVNHTTPSNFSRIADGIVHMRVRAYGTNGVLVPLMNPEPQAFSTIGNMQAQQDPIGTQFNTGDYDYAFRSNAVPAAVEIELAVLEPRSLERFNGFTNTPAAAVTWLQGTNRSSRVHVFRQRISIRNVDPTAYQ